MSLPDEMLKRDLLLNNGLIDRVIVDILKVYDANLPYAFIPMGIIGEVLRRNHGANFTNKEQAVSHLMAIKSVVGWQYFRGIYQVSPDLMNQYAKRPLPKALTLEKLCHLPQQVCYFELDHAPYQGFYASIDPVVWNDKGSLNTLDLLFIGLEQEDTPTFMAVQVALDAPMPEWVIGNPEVVKAIQIVLLASDPDFQVNDRLGQKSDPYCGNGSPTNKYTRQPITQYYHICHRPVLAS